MRLTDPPNIPIRDLPIAVPGEVGLGDRTYNGSFGGIRAIVNIPSGFRDKKYRRGLAAAYTVERVNEQYEGHLIRVVLHQAPGTAADLISGWSAWHPDFVDETSEGVFGQSQIDSIMSSQRFGEWVYVLTYVHTDFSGVEGCVIRRFNTLDYAESAYFHNYVLGGNNGNGGLSPMINSISANTAMHVSDTFPPEIWFVNGNQAWKVTDDGTDWGYNDFQADYFSYFDLVGSENPNAGPRIVGPWGDFHDFYSTPDGVREDDVFGPYLVFPWTSFDYEPPVLWWFVKERDKTGSLTQRLGIYEARWKQGERVGPRARTVAYPGASNAVYYDSGNASKTNPTGFAFEHDWYDAKHKIGAVGPFPNTKLNDGAFLSGYAPTDKTIQFRSIRVMRDQKRRHTMHIVFESPHSTPQYDDSYDRFNAVFYTTSGDDGKNWTRVRQVSPAPHGETRTDAYGTLHDAASPAGGAMSAVRTSTGFTVGTQMYQLQTRIPPTGVTNHSIPALFVVDGDGVGSGQEENRTYVYQRGEVRRQSWV